MTWQPACFARESFFFFFSLAERICMTEWDAKLLCDVESAWFGLCAEYYLWHWTWSYVKVNNGVSTVNAAFSFSKRSYDVMVRVSWNVDFQKCMGSNFLVRTFDTRFSVVFLVSCMSLLGYLKISCNSCLEHSFLFIASSMFLSVLRYWNVGC